MTITILNGDVLEHLRELPDQSVHCCVTSPPYGGYINMVLKPLLHMEQIDYAYLAGAMDADGYFTIKRNTYSVRVTKDSKNPSYSERIGIKQTTELIPKMIYENYGGYFHIEKPNAKKGKPLFSIDLRNKKAISFLEDIFPYLKIKKRQGEILFELRKTKGEPRTETHSTSQKSRWGDMMCVTKHSISKDQIIFKENLIKELDTLNDIRQCKFSQTKEWRND